MQYFKAAMPRQDTPVAHRAIPCSPMSTLRVTLGLMGIGLPDAALSACFLTGLGNARTESQLLGQLEVLAYKVALDSSGGNGGGAAAGGGCGRYGSGGADPRDQARKDAISTWRELCTCGLVKVGEGGYETK